MAKRSRRRNGSDGPVSLFPFLAVLICTMGSLTFWENHLAGDSSDFGHPHLRDLVPIIPLRIQVSYFPPLFPEYLLSHLHTVKNVLLGPSK